MTGDGQGAFAAADAVGRYWLAHCDGFEARSVDGEPIGFVASVEHDYAGAASTLVVERRHGRPLQLRPGAVALVDPWQESLVVMLPPRGPRAVKVRAASHATARGARACGTQASRAGRSVGRAARSAAPPSGRAALWLGTRTAYALAFAAWLYGAALFVVSRYATRVLLFVTRQATRLVVWITPPLVSAARGVGRAAARLPGRIRSGYRRRGEAVHWLPRRHP